ncbi:MAG TPA: hypothetical protein VJ227_03530 [Patescibacteria group bacterium]|nr:hypothetical protein [Patescibacteria group bacterium]
MFIAISPPAANRNIAAEKTRPLSFMVKARQAMTPAINSALVLPKKNSIAPDTTITTRAKSVENDGTTPSPVISLKMNGIINKQKYFRCRLFFLNNIHKISKDKTDMSRDIATCTDASFKKKPSTIDANRKKELLKPSLE